MDHADWQDEKYCKELAATLATQVRHHAVRGGMPVHYGPLWLCIRFLGCWAQTGLCGAGDDVVLVMTWRTFLLAQRILGTQCRH